MDKVKQVMETAIQMEKDGIKYYSDAAKNTESKLAEKMFKFLIEDEKRHIEKLKQVAKEESIDNVGKTESVKTAEKIKTIFSSAGSADKKTTASSDEAEVLSHAIGMEEKGISYYTEQSIELEGKAAELCRLIAEEEKIHRDLLQNTLHYIRSNWQWNIETEGWSFEG